MLKKLRSLFKRQQTTPLTIKEGSGWRPVGGYYKSTLPAVSKALKIYTDLITNVELSPSDHYFSKLLNMPNSFDSKRSFFERLVSNYFLFGCFYGYLKYDNQSGQIQKVIPVLPRDIFCYPLSGDFSDGIGIESGGYYYQDSKGRIHQSDSILALKDMTFCQSDLLNPIPRISAFAYSFQTGMSLEQIKSELSYGGLRGSLLLSGLPEESNENFSAVRKVISDFFKSGNATSGCLSLPSGYELKNMNLPSVERALQIISTLNDTSIARIFNMPIELLSSTDNSMQASANNLKEQHRFFLRTAGASFLKIVSECFTKTVADGTEFSFKLGRLKGSDLREISQFIKQLVDSKVLSAEQARDMLDL